MNARLAEGSMMAVYGGPYPIRYTLHIPSGTAKVETLHKVSCDLAGVALPLLGKKQRYAYLVLFQPEWMHDDPDAHGCAHAKSVALQLSSLMLMSDALRHAFDMYISFVYEAAMVPGFWCVSASWLVHSKAADGLCCARECCACTIHLSRADFGCELYGTRARLDA